METPWYQCSESDRIQQYYAKYTIKDFWDWWSSGESKVMEVRIKDFQLLKTVAQELNMPYSASGIYVWSAVMLKAVIAKVRDKAVIWFGINPRKRNFNKNGYKGFGGMEPHVLQIDFLFIDIDRILKEGPATTAELENSDKMANALIERFAIQKWAESYAKLCSGNGNQLLIKLDIPIKLPEVTYDAIHKEYLPNEAFEKVKAILRAGIGEDIAKFCSAYNRKEELGIQLDKSCFKLNQVAALPFTKNYKYGGFTWRGIIDLKDGVNEGLTDYIMSKESDVELYKSKNVFRTIKGIKDSYRIRPGKLAENPIVRLILENDLPHVGINNKLWFQLKCLLRDSKFDWQSEEFKTVHKLLERKYKASLTTNIPDRKFGFDENIVNSFCIEACLPPIYPLWPKRTKKVGYNIEHLEGDWEWVKGSIELPMQLESDTTILEDMNVCKQKMTPNGGDNSTIFMQFVKGCISKYGEEKARYYFQYIMLKYLCYE